MNSVLRYLHEMESNIKKRWKKGDGESEEEYIEWQIEGEIWMDGEIDANYILYQYIFAIYEFQIYV